MAVSFIYKKYTNPPASQVRMYPNLNNEGLVIVTEKPDWVSVTGYFDSQTSQYHIFYSLIKSKADSMPAGNYTGQVYIGLKIDGNIGFLAADLVSLNLVDNVLLSISPSAMAFQYTIGGNIPATKTLSVTATSNWSVAKDKSWITISRTNGINNGTVAIGINPSGLAIGNYTGAVRVNDGTTERVLNVSLTVQGEPEPEEFLNINPTSLAFSETEQTPPTQHRSLNIEASESWNMTSTQPWVVLSATSGSSGTSVVDVSVSHTSLAVGNYEATLEIKTASIVRNVYVSLRVTRISIIGIESGNLYFADDRNYLYIDDTEENTKVLIDFEAYKNGQAIRYPKEAPYFRAQAKVLIGFETENLIAGDPVVSNFFTGAYIPIIPVSYDFTVYNKKMFTGDITERQKFTNVRFLTGQTPVSEDRLTYLPSEITTVTNGIIALSFLTDEAPETIDITGDVMQSIPLSISESNPAYTALIDLSELGLVPGNVITITILGHSVTVNIKKPEIERTIFAFINEWNCPEYITFTGKLRINDRADYETTTRASEGKEITKIIRARKPIEYDVNTGFVYSQAERDWLMNIFKSKRMFLFINGERIEVENLTNTLTPYETREYLHSYQLKFRSVVL